MTTNTIEPEAEDGGWSEDFLGDRLVACVAFSGDLKPNVSAAAVTLARCGYEVALMPERYRPLLGHPLDDFLEAFKRVRGNEETIARATSGMMDEVNAIVDGFGGACHECGVAEDGYVAEFCGLTRDELSPAEVDKQQA
jgi:hypothetical protein